MLALKIKNKNKSKQVGETCLEFINPGVQALSIVTIFRKKAVKAVHLLMSNFQTIFQHLLILPNIGLSTM